MKTYLAHTKRLAAATPEHRNRVVDFWRALAIMVVVVGHWLAASIWLTPNDDIKLLNSLEWVPYADWVTWVVQVMPIFFLAGGYANAKALGSCERGDEPRRDWITKRTRRMFTPVVPLLVVWAALIVLLRGVVPEGVLHAGAMSATLPLWFLAVYISLTALAPATYRWWQRSGPTSVVALLAAAGIVDVARFVFGVPGAGWVNFVFVWAAVHQIGYWWSSLDARGGVSSTTGWLVFGGGLGVLVTLVTAGLYPVAMLGIPGAAVTNMTPPTLAMAILGVVQLGFIWGVQPVVARFTATARGWHLVVALSGVIMTVYLWHLSAMSFVAATGLLTFDGAIFGAQPGSALWWWTRPVWVALLAVVTVGLVALFARFEWRISKKPAPAAAVTVIAGIVLIVGSTAAVALEGLATKAATVQWAIPITAAIGAALVGALPQRQTSAES